MGFEHRRKRLGRELSALVRIEDRRRSVVDERVLEGLDTEVAVRSGPRNLDSGLSEISIVFQAAVPKLVASK